MDFVADKQNIHSAHVVETTSSANENDIVKISSDDDEIQNLLDNNVVSKSSSTVSLPDSSLHPSGFDEEKPPFYHSDTDILQYRRSRYEFLPISCNTKVFLPLTKLLYHLT